MSAKLPSTDDLTFTATVLQSPEPVLVDFWAPWCGPCRMIAPILEQFAEEYKGRLRVVQVNADENPQTVACQGIMGMPTLVFFHQGREVHRVIGAWPRPKLVEAVEQVLAAAAA